LLQVRNKNGVQAWWVWNKLFLFLCSVATVPNDYIPFKILLFKRLDQNNLLVNLRGTLSLRNALSSQEPVILKMKSKACWNQAQLEFFFQQQKPSRQPQNMKRFREVK